jgi:hypothetical protein
MDCAAACGEKGANGNAAKSLGALPAGAFIEP